MAFQQFTYPGVQAALGLTLTEADLFGHVKPVEVSPEFADRLRLGLDLAVGTHSEKARSEFVIAPVLMEVLRMLSGRIGIHSGVEFNVDPARGLNGYCDFLVTRSPIRSLVKSPVIAVAEAKNDSIPSGLGQCIAAMVASQEFNKRAGDEQTIVHGVTTTGTAWRFLRLDGSDLRLDPHEIYVAEIGRILGILAHILRES